MALTVSALADQVGLSADTVRYYERVGLLPEPARSAAGYRLYDQDAVARLRLIRGAQRAGLRLREIGELLQVADQACAPAGTPRPSCASGWPRSGPSWSACAASRPS
jgi:DNA-binding transcriptional MerR regulator